MSQQDRSRRSHHSARISRRGQFVLLGGSILVFLAGSTCFAWAVADARATYAQSAERADTAQPGSAEDRPLVETDASASSSTRSGESDSTEATGLLSNVEEVVEAKPPAESKKAGTGDKPTQKRPASKKKRKKRAAKASAAEKPGRKPSPAAKRNRPAHTGKTMRINHTAYKKIAVYRTQHHKASSFIESDAESESPTRESCPICGKQHKHGFAKRVLDHYEHRYCSACGKKHAKPYVEVVRTK